MKQKHKKSQACAGSRESSPGQAVSLHQALKMLDCPIGLPISRVSRLVTLPLRGPELSSADFQWLHPGGHGAQPCNNSATPQQRGSHFGLGPSLLLTAHGCLGQAECSHSDTLALDTLFLCNSKIMVIQQQGCHCDISCIWVHSIDFSGIQSKKQIRHSRADWWKQSIISWRCKIASNAIIYYPRAWHRKQGPKIK